MGTLSLYARKEATVDPMLKGSAKRDTVIYRDKEATDFSHRIPWDFKAPSKGDKFIMCGCFKYNLVWI
jgi:hypothetical protein